MYEFVERDEGFLVVHKPSGKPLANVDTKTITEDNDPRLRVPERKVTPIPSDRWRVHFTSLRLTPPDLVAFIEELARQKG